MSNAKFKVCQIEIVKVYIILCIRSASLSHFTLIKLLLGIGKREERKKEKGKRNGGKNLLRKTFFFLLHIYICVVLLSSVRLTLSFFHLSRSLTHLLTVFPHLTKRHEKKQKGKFLFIKFYMPDENIYIYIHSYWREKSIFRFFGALFFSLHAHTQLNVHTHTHTVKSGNICIHTQNFLLLVRFPFFWEIHNMKKFIYIFLLFATAAAAATVVVEAFSTFSIV
jgi:hypothetical protein